MEIPSNMIWILFIVVAFACASSEKDLRLGKPTVVIAQGTVVGEDKRYERGRVDRFIAIPYASPPIEDLRFKPPIAHPGWDEEIYDASGGLGPELKSKMCLQGKMQSGLFSDVIGSEDCLYINVWVPGGVDEARKNPLPVMAWIHGDGYAFGSSWGPKIRNERLYDLAPMAINGDVIGVSFNYRLGPFGFLSTGDENSPGNYGMLDQVMALQWIHDNIWAFGGIPEQLTIFGQSTGATSVSFHMLSPLSTDLFLRGISESGTALSQWAIQQDPHKAAVELANALNCTTEDNQLLIACVKLKPAEEIATAVPVYGLRKRKNLDLPWAPVIDGNFLPSRPELLMANAARKSYLLGSNSMDGHLFAGLDFPIVNIPFVPLTELSLFRASRLLHANMILEVSRNIDYQYQKFAAERDRHFYKNSVVDLYTDYMFTGPTNVMAQEHSFLASNLSTGASTFVYVFSEPRKRSLIQLDMKLDGAEHGQELQYVFDVPDRAPLKYGRSEKALAQSMMRYWTNFAWTGDPNQGPSKDQPPAIWPAFDPYSKLYLDLNTSLSDNGDSAVAFAYRGEYMAFWGRIIPQLWGSAIGICEQFESLSSTEWSKEKSVDDEEITYEFNANDLYVPEVKMECEPGDFIRPTIYGCIDGEFAKWNGRSLVRYLGIPYASPPIGDFRFDKPQSPAAWTDVRSATQFGKVCPQYPFDSSTMDEDCLYLNIYVPIDTTLPYDYVIPGRYAVMVWIHGGGYMSGDGSQSYGGEVLSSSEEVIVVTLNYRLGAIGFLSTGNRFSPGNYALWDQNLAMQWVRDNIVYFGGDPTRVTIFGQGAGAECAQLHTISGAVASRSLGFNRTILESGTVLSLEEYPDQIATSEVLASRVGCDGLAADDMVDCLRLTPIEELITAQNLDSSSEDKLQFAPVVDGSFLSKDPKSAMSFRQLTKWEFMIGVTSGDGTPYWDQVEEVQSSEDFRDNIKQTFGGKYGVSSDDIQFQYTEWENPSFNSDTEEMKKQLFNLYTDERYISPANFVAMKAATVLSDVYMYYLTYPYMTETQQQYPSWTGVMHGGDLPYVWGDIVRDPVSEGNNPEAAALCYDIMNYWANFAKTGNPNLEENGEQTSAIWPKYTTRFREYMRLDPNLMSSSSYLRGKQVSFWNFILPSLEVSCPLFLP